MLPYKICTDLVEIVCFALPIALLVYSETEISERRYKYTLPVVALLSLGLICVALSEVTQSFVPPNQTVHGVIVEFHKAGNRGSKFAFRVLAGGQFGPSLNLTSSDLRFYMRAAPLRDGDVAQVLFNLWSHEVIAMEETAGKHSGWRYDRKQRPTVSSVLAIIGSFLFVRTMVSVRRHFRSMNISAPSSRAS